MERTSAIEIMEKLANDRNTIAEMEGEIRGLKFSIMCNGVSGGEINAPRR